MICQNVPTKTDLYTDNFVVLNTQDFGITPFLSIRFRHFIRYDDFIVMFYKPQKVERPCPAPGQHLSKYPVQSSPTSSGPEKVKLSAR